MRTLFYSSILVILLSPICYSQAPVTVVSSGWERARKAAKKSDDQPVGPARAMTEDNKLFRRTAREAQTTGVIDPNQNTIDGRSAALEKAVNESRSRKAEDVEGYTYRAVVKNDSPKNVTVIYWEYRFKEIANPSNEVRRQFLCAVNVKPGDKKELPVFSTLGPSDVIGADSLASSTGEKIFDEKVLVNRIEFSDGSLVQRGNWKFEDVQKAVERITSTPWGTEICRGF